MVKVKMKATNKIVDVYGVRSDKTRGDFFLVYVGNKFSWLATKFFEPIDQNTTGGKKNGFSLS